MTTEAVQEIRVGAFSPYTCNISPQAQASFEEATKALLGVSYSPVAVSQQVVAGINYKFFCNSRSATAHPLQGAAILSIYQPLEGPAHITHIQTL